MLSMLYFSLIIFTMISESIQNIDTTSMDTTSIDTDQIHLNPPARSCFNLTSPGNTTDEGNSCERTTRYKDAEQTNGPTIPSISCIIHNYSENITSDDCVKDTEFVEFTFYDSVTFERFFKQYRDVIPKLFPNQSIAIPNPNIQIKVYNYNITEITNGYINSTLNMDAPNVIMYIRFENYTQGLQALVVRNISFPIGFDTLGIIVLCNNNTKNVKYYNVHRIQPTGVRVIIEDSCKNLQSTQQVSPKNINLLPIRKEN
jgi:hypothetical protein